jgi:hypothetical protein
MKKKLMILGMGELAWWTLEILCRTPGFPDFVEVLVCDRDEENGLRRMNSAILSAASTHNPTQAYFKPIDLFNHDQTTQMISSFAPDLIFDCTSLQSWWVITTLPKESFQKIDVARYGPWIPMHCTLTQNIMKAVKESGVSTKVVNSGFPDVTNCALGKIGLAPHIGIGNIDNLAIAVKRYLAEKENVPQESIQLYMYMGHFLSYYAGRYSDTAGSPFMIKSYVDGHDKSDEYDQAELLCEATKKFRRLGGTQGHSVVGASCAKNILHTFQNRRSITYSPGPCGLPGGYAVRIGSDDVDVALPPGVSLDEVIEINKLSNKYDGIEDILDDGTVVITDESHKIMKDVMGYDCKQMKLEDSAKWAEELRTKFLSWAEKEKKR